MEFLEHIDTILFVLTSIVTIASILLKYIAPKTQTLIDDKIYAYVVKTLEVLSFAHKVSGEMKNDKQTRQNKPKA